VSLSHRRLLGRTLALPLVIGGITLGSLAVGEGAFAQPAPGAQPVPVRPAQLQPDRAQPGQPQPGQPQPGQPQPGLQQPGAQPPPGQPGAIPNPDDPNMPGRRPPPRPRMPRGPDGLPGRLPPGAGMQPRPLQMPAPVAPAADSHAGGDHGEAHHCPGHGPNDSPHHINWYQGLLGVDNEKSQSQSFVDRLFWRYKNDKDECDPKNQEPPFLASFINFALVGLIVYRFGKGPITGALSQRKKSIMHEIDAAQELRSDAEERLADYERQLARIEERGKELRAELRAQFDDEKKRVLSDAEEKAKRMRRDAELRVEQELKQAEYELVIEAVDTSMAAAAQLLEKRVESRDLDRLADEYLAGIGEAITKADAKPRGRQEALS
jgi:F-type H+-transporting ATPase subunit b